VTGEIKLPDRSRTRTITAAEASSKTGVSEGSP